jgi:predicted transcriptional regulator/transcriptional regulator with XRE-family HTH domain
MAMTEAREVGLKLRRLRRERGLTQADLASRLGISASYLNLLEHNRRKITVDLLFAVAAFFGIQPADLVDEEEERLASHLMEVFADDVFADSDVTNLDVRDLAHSSPSTARAVLKLYDHFRSGRQGPGQAPADGQFHRASDAISDFIQEQLNYFEPLEAAAQRVGEDMANAGEGFDAGARAYLHNVYGVDLRIESLPRGLVRTWSATAQVLTISDMVDDATRRFLVAQHIGMLSADREIDDIIAGSGLPETDAPVLARNVLSAYFAAALLMPYDDFLKACRHYRYDIERIGRRFQTSFEQVCHRMTTLQRRGASGIPLHLVRTDIAGNISKRFSASGIVVPRHSGACARWNIYSAFLSPDRINVQLSEMPDGTRFFCVAKAIAKGAERYNAPIRHLSIGIGCSILHAREMIYSDGIDFDHGTIVPIGVSCRICPRKDCSHRASLPADHHFQLSEDNRPETIYARLL